MDLFAHELATAYPDLDLVDPVAVDSFVHDAALYHDDPIVSVSTAVDPQSEIHQKPRQMSSVPLSDSYSHMQLLIQPTHTAQNPQITDDAWGDQSALKDDLPFQNFQPNMQLETPSSSSSASPPVSQQQLPQFSVQPTTSPAAQIYRLTQDTPDMQHVLSSHGKVLFVSPAVVQMLGYSQTEFTDKFVAEYVAPDDVEYFTRELNRAATHGVDPDSDEAHVSIICRFKRADGTCILVEVVGRAHFNTDGNAHVSKKELRLNKSRDCTCFFLTARPYRTKSSALIDSFLEHKIENIRLKQMLANLRGPDTISPSAILSSNAANDPMQFQTLQPGFLESDSARLRRHSAGDAIVVASKDNARMKSTSSDSSVSSVSTDTYNAYPLLSPTGRGKLSVSNGNADKPTKKPKVSDDKEYVCTECGTLDSPEWRKGPQGPKTLCNACGLRWSKSLKKKTLGSSSSKSRHSHTHSVS
ncbi:hypothetical protein POJ06DRAFT_54036 [Lipomyces tetrasporus]|uniref:Uncharacterized protein n=1 Tax=Lipomyces tetrasporus TaxID=54092 RepID=A0AAD7VV83_9ASCO|nr:uncharacterized protein POJ06DRAFT_54036 [Lipomyces tetrasporus]KAJ8102699.1 hypothetical protein POJ06DRAFT_54036 [Lipomyces tetrasporus]